MATTIGLTFDEKTKLPEETEKFKCPHCEKEYAKIEYLNSHISKKHPEV